MCNTVVAKAAVQAAEARLAGLLTAATRVEDERAALARERVAANPSDHTTASKRSARQSALDERAATVAEQLAAARSRLNEARAEQSALEAELARETAQRDRERVLAELIACDAEFTGALLGFMETHRNIGQRFTQASREAFRLRLEAPASRLRGIPFGADATPFGREVWTALGVMAEAIWTNEIIPHQQNSRRRASSR